MNFGIAKSITALAWVLVLVNFFGVFPGWFETTLYVVGALLVVAHLGEYIVFHKTIAAREEGPVTAFVMTFFFGIFYWKDVA